VVFDLAGNATLIGVREQYQVASRQGQVGGDARAFGADGALGDLDDDVGARRVEPGDVLVGDAGALALALAAVPCVVFPLPNAWAAEPPDEIIVTSAKIEQLGSLFLECVVAPGFHEGARQRLAARTNLPAQAETEVAALARYGGAVRFVG
jgi:hypothetical protein